MGNRAAKFISTLFASIIAGAPLAAVSQNAPSAPGTASAAGDCLASPKGAAPQGQHWYYRLDRSTKRQCWYLRAEGGKAVQSAQATTDAPAADSPAPQPRSVQDARAEYFTPQSTAAPGMIAQTATAPAAAPPSPVTSDSNAEQPAVATRWPDTAATTASPAPQPVASSATAAARPAKSSAAPAALATAEIPADKPTGSLQTLLLVIVGALALAGILASVIYRFAGARERVQASDRRVIWDDWEPQDQRASRAPWVDGTPRVPQPQPIDFDAARPRPQQAATLVAFADEIARVAAQAAPTHVKAAEPDEAETDEAVPEVFHGEFEIETSAPQLAAIDTDAAIDTHEEAPDDRAEDARDEDVDIDVITAMLERMAKEGPRLAQPSLEADLADLARIPRGQSAARA